MEFGLQKDWKIGWINSPKGDGKIRYAIYSRQAKPDAYILFLNGRTEWIEKYSYVAEDLGIPENWGFISVDHRGQGFSVGLKGHVETYDDFALDLKALTMAICKDTPYFTLTHSMGGLINLYAMVKGCIKPRFSIMCAPLLAMPNKPFPAVVSKALSGMLTNLGLGQVSTGLGRFDTVDFEKNVLTHSRQRFERLIKSPCPVLSPTFAWVSASFAAVSTIYEPANLRQLNIPIKIIQGTQEAVVPIGAAEEWQIALTQNSENDAELVLIEGGRHELLSEEPAIYKKALDEINDFINLHKDLLS